MKGVFIIIDGVADEPCQVLGQKTPLESAKMPNLDEIAHKSKMDYCYTVREGFVPGSEHGVVSLLGYNISLADRGPLEALGLGIKLKNGDLALRCNFATIDDLQELHVLDRRAGRTLTTKEAQELAKVINEKVKLPFEFKFYPGVQHRGVLVIKGGFSNNITGVEQGHDGKVSFSKSLDEESDSRLASELVNNFSRQCFEILDKHPLNIARAKKGLYSANFVICRGAGNKPAKFPKLRGKWIDLGYMPLEIGIARAAGMNVHGFQYPELKDIDVYENLYEGLERAIKYSIRMLKRNRDKFDYCYLHFKETDIPGHDNKPLDKVRMLEILDKKFFSYLKKFIMKTSDMKLVITADHATPCRRKAHAADPVPVLIYPHPKGESGAKRFTEAEGLKGKRIYPRKLLEDNLFSKK